jgi:predicted HicB family RNase H-like nuclease
MMRYKGYVGVMEVDPDTELIHGRVIGLRDVITFQGDTAAEARQAFQDSVDDYLEWCAAEARPPEKPFSGKLLIRVEPALHRNLAQLAEARSTSINSLVVEALANLAGESKPKASKRSK